MYADLQVILEPHRIRHMRFQMSVQRDGKDIRLCPVSDFCESFGCFTAVTGYEPKHLANVSQVDYSTQDLT